MSTHQPHTAPASEYAPGRAHAHAGAHGEDHPHVAPWQILTGVLVILLIMTGVTVYTALEVNLGATGNLVLALAIAGFKSALVLGFFMHLHWDNKFNAVVLLYCLIAIFTFLVFTILDIGSRDAIDPQRAVLMQPEIVSRARDAAIAAGEGHHPEAAERAEQFQEAVEAERPYQSPTLQEQPTKDAGSDTP